MKFKLDENLGSRCIDILLREGHDVATIAGQSMTSASDSEVIQACRLEKTLDLDFSNPLVFPPSQYAGIAVLRLRSKPSHADLIAVVQTLAEAVKQETLSGKLWSVETGRIRVYQETDEI